MTKLGVRLTFIIFALPITIGVFLWELISVVTYFIGRPIDNVGEHLYFTLFLMCLFVYYSYLYIKDLKKIRKQYNERYGI